MNVNPINMGDADQITQSIESFARAPNGGLIVTASGASLRHRDLIVKLVARYKLPTVYYERVFVTAGGPIAYGADFVDQYRAAQPVTLIASSKARSRPTYRCRCRPSMS